MGNGCASAIRGGIDARLCFGEFFVVVVVVVECWQAFNPFNAHQDK